MNKNIVKEIWEIRGLADKGIYECNPELIIKAKESMNELSVDGEIYDVETALTLGAKHYYRFQRDEDILRNFNSIILNLQSIYDRFVKGEDVSAKFGTKPKSILEYVWVLRAMLDDIFYTYKKNPALAMEKIELMEVIEQTINKCVNEFSAILTKAEDKNALQEIRTQILVLRKKIFKDKRLVKDFDYFRENY